MSRSGAVGDIIIFVFVGGDFGADVLMTVQTFPRGVVDFPERDSLGLSLP